MQAWIVKHVPSGGVATTAEQVSDGVYVNVPHFFFSELAAQRRIDEANNGKDFKAVEVNLYWMEKK